MIASRPPLRYDDSVLSFLFAVGLPSSVEDADAALLRGVARGDRAALAKLYDRWSATLVAVALRVLSSRAEAEEVVQDAFVEVWTRAAQFEAARGSARGWVVAIARNRAIDRLRTRGSVGRTLDRARNEAEPLSAPATPADVAELHELRERMQTALLALPPEQRQTIELAYYEGLSQSEIAERTGEPIGTVKSRVRAAMEKLARLVARERGEVGP